MSRAPVAPAPRRWRWTSRAAACCVGLVLLTHLGVGWPAVRTTPAAESTSAVSLVDGRNGAALFTSTGLRPGRVERACVALSVTGTPQPSSEVGLSAEVPRAELAPYLLLAVERGVLADPASCASFSGAGVWTGTLAQLPGTVATAVPTGWRPAQLARTVFRITVTVLDDPRAQGLGAAATFVWALDDEPPAPVPVPAPLSADPSPEATTAPGGVASPTPRPPAAAREPTRTPTPTPEQDPAPSTEPAPTGPAPTEPASTVPPTDAPGGPSAGVGDVVQARPLAAAPSRVAQVAAAMGKTALAVVDDAQFPLALVALVIGFLFVQGRLDRRDPKLALARVRQDLDDFRDFPEIPRTAT